MSDFCPFCSNKGFTSQPHPRALGRQLVETCRCSDEVLTGAEIARRLTGHIDAERAARDFADAMMPDRAPEGGAA